MFGASPSAAIVTVTHARLLPVAKTSRRSDAKVRSSWRAARPRPKPAPGSRRQPDLDPLLRPFGAALRFGVEIGVGEQPRRPRRRLETPHQGRPPAVEQLADVGMKVADVVVGRSFDPDRLRGVAATERQAQSIQLQGGSAIRCPKKRS